MRSIGRSFCVLMLALSAMPFAFGSDTDNPSCRNHPRVIAACYTVHGRLSNWNGNPTERIWVIGTKRILGLREGTTLPKVLEGKLNSFDLEVDGDFEFCPFAQQKSGLMQVGCVAKVANYQIKGRKQ